MDIAGICAVVDKVREIVSRPEILAKFHPANDIQKLLFPMTALIHLVLRVMARWLARLLIFLRSLSMR